MLLGFYPIALGFTYFHSAQKLKLVLKQASYSANILSTYQADVDIKKKKKKNSNAELKAYLGQE